MRSSTLGDRPTRSKLRKLVSLPGAAAGIILAAALTWGVQQYLPKAVGKIHQSRPVAVNVNMNAAALSSFAQNSFHLFAPAGVKLSNTQPFGVGCSEWYAHALANGAVPIGETDFRLIVQGLTDETVTLSDLRPRIVSHVEVPDGNPVTCPSAGESVIRSVMFELENPTSGSRYLTEDMALKPFEFSVDRHDTEVFDIRAFAKRGYYKWFLELRVVRNGREQVVVASDHGKPFETIGSSEINNVRQASVSVLEPYPPSTFSFMLPKRNYSATKLRQMACQLKVGMLRKEVYDLMGAPDQTSPDVAENPLEAARAGQAYWILGGVSTTFDIRGRLKSGSLNSGRGVQQPLRVVCGQG